ncbi:DnaJ domain-containing protein [Cyanobacterium aponinum AL20118]|uniref:DnaJ domain-containing protein n=1 Tax=Cyanobacterium aponinum AL20115 TaxID=3090662 RepID=A0AAF0ZDX9_9CHRO|nr:DnaJ domain-containing protein [Cyanobacterium aponinum]PHV64342.1 molecular chaperone DnaJ [Cyanobacterium aponinum IPPAS B-1201]WPF87574.1 DnaJ domain-containing protein [Cyanobacterium aponinum AL20115]
MLISDLKGGLFKYEVKDYYAILGLPISANPKDIRLRYLKLAYQLHPDTNQAETKENREKASTILSKLVNPAYENLYKDKLRKECQLIFSEISMRLAPMAKEMTLSGEIPKKLLREEANFNKMYQDLIETLAKEQYQDLSKLAVKIGLLSELNMIYLVRQKQGELGKVMGGTSSNVEPKIAVSEPIITAAPEQSDNTGVSQQVEEKEEKVPVSRLEKLINSAKNHIEQFNPDAALFDLREAVKIDANSAVAHAMLGSVYLLQNNLPYGRIHINKAVGIDSNNPTVKKAQEELKQKEKKSSTGKTDGKKTESKGSDKEKSKDKKGKKEPPKIFGIPLW